MKKAFLAVASLFVVTCLFFYPIFKGNVPFPGDLLIGGYAPYKMYPFQGYAPGGYPNKGQDFDVLELLYPGKEFVINQIKQGTIPLWNPYIFSGHPQFAALQAGALYPLNIIFFVFPFINAWTIFIFIEPLLAALFTYIFLRKLKISHIPSILGAVVFSFSSYMLVWLEYGNMDHSVIWLPLALYLVIVFMEKPRYITGLLVSGVLAFSLLAGYIQTTFFLFLFVFAFGIFLLLHHKERSISNVFKFILIFLLPVCIAAVQLVPTFELIFNSARSAFSYHEYLTLLIPNYHLITLFAPDFFGNPATRNYWVNGTYIERLIYVGVIPLFFTLYALFTRRDKWMYFFGGSLLVVLLLTVNTPVAHVLYAAQLPLVSTAVPTRILFLFSFSMSVLAALGFENFISHFQSKRIYLSLTVLGFVYLTLWLFVFLFPHISHAPWVHNLTIAKHNLILPTLFFVLTIIAVSASYFFARKFKGVYAVFLLIAILDLFYTFQKITPFASRASVYPSTPVVEELRQIQGINRSWGYGSAYFSPDIQTHEKIYTTDGYDALHDKRYGQLISASVDGRVAQPLPRSDVNLAPGFGPDSLKVNRYRKRLLDLLGVKYILNSIDPALPNPTPDTLTFPGNKYTLVYQNGPFQIYRNDNALPRFFLASSVKVSDGSHILRDIVRTNLPLRTVYIEKRIPGYHFKKSQSASAKLFSYTPNRIEIETNAQSDTLLFLSDVYYPGWTALVDGKSTQIVRSDYAFRGVPLHKGAHKIIFTYEPESFAIGRDITITTLMLLVILTSIVFIGKKHEERV